MKRRFLLFTAMIVAVSAVTAISFAQRKPDTADKPITGDFKITIRNTAGGQSSQSTTMIKGKRERSESSTGGMSTGNMSITQCDLRRIIQVNDRSRKYLITPMDSDSGDADSGAAASSTTGRPHTRGGVGTMAINTIDTGERKEMIGFTARHCKRAMTVQTAPDRCYRTLVANGTD